MSNTNIDRIFTELRDLSQKKGYLLFDDLEKGTEGLSLNEVNRLTNRLLTTGVDIFDAIPESTKNGRNLTRHAKTSYLSGTLLLLKYKSLKATGTMVDPNGFVVFKGSEYNEFVTSSCTNGIYNRRRELMQLGKMKNGVLTEDIHFGSPSTAAKVLIGNSVNGNILWVDSKGYTLKQLLAEKERRANGE